MKAACDDCPFRNDRKPYIPGQRALEIVEGLDRGQFFECHKTCIVNPSGETLASGQDLQHCAGAMAYLENQGEPSLHMMVAEVAGKYDPNKMKRSNIFKNSMEMIRAYFAPRVLGARP